jgi:dTDP-4-dehydrorhamnose reductase
MRLLVTGASNLLGDKIVEFAKNDYTVIPTASETNVDKCETEKGNYTEQDTPNPTNHYGVAKLEGESQVVQNCRNYVILRTSVL